MPSVQAKVNEECLLVATSTECGARSYIIDIHECILVQLFRNRRADRWGGMNVEVSRFLEVISSLIDCVNDSAEARVLNQSPDGAEMRVRMKDNMRISLSAFTEAGSSWHVLMDTTQQGMNSHHGFQMKA